MLCRNKFSFKLDRLFNKSILNIETSKNYNLKIMFVFVVLLNLFADLNALNDNPMKTEF